MFIIDVLRHDIEDMDAILRMLNSTSALGWREFWPRDFHREEVLEALGRLVKAGMVRPLRYDHTKRELIDIDDYIDVTNTAEPLWFKLERPGLAEWNRWDWPEDEAQ